MDVGLKEGQSLTRQLLFLGTGSLCYDMLALSCGSHVWVSGDHYHRNLCIAVIPEVSSALRLRSCDSPAHGGTPTASFCWDPCDPEGIPFGVGRFKDSSSSATFPGLPLAPR